MAYRETAKTQKKKEQRYASILQAALELTAEEGFAALTVSAIAERAGVATGSVYRYFPNKSELCSVVFRTASQEELDIVDEILRSSASPAEGLKQAIRVFAERALNGPQIARALIAEPCDERVDDDRSEFKQRYAALFAENIHQGIERGDFPEQNILLSAAGIVGVLAEVLIAENSGCKDLSVSPDNREQWLSQLESLCLRALGYSA